MERLSTLTEILLMTGTSFSARQYREKEETPGQLNTDRERLQAACWNGMLKEMLPEIFEQSESNLFLWQIKEADSFLELELSEFPVTKDPYDSIDPYAFLSSVCLS